MANASPALLPALLEIAFAASERSEASEVAKLRLLDYAGALLSGYDTETATIFGQTMARLGGADASMMLPSGIRTSPVNAAGANAAVAHACETDDVHVDTTGYHPGVTLIPAVLSVGEAEAVPGDRLLKSIIFGYEVGGRIGAAVTPSHRERGFHATGTIGALGAAAAAAHAMALTDDQIMSAIGLATSMSAGTFAVLEGGIQGKHLHAAHAAMSGVFAAMLAAGGLKGSATALEAREGFFKAFSGAADLSRLLGEKDTTLEIDRVMVKPFPCCAHAFGPVEFSIELSNELEAESIERIEIDTYPAAAVLSDARPDTVEAAKLSIPYCVATAFRHGSLSSHQFSSTERRDILASGLMDRVSLGRSPEAVKAFPAERLVTFTLHSKDGQVHRRAHRAPLGFPGRALDATQVKQKFRAAAMPVLGSRAGEVEALVLGFDSLSAAAANLGSSLEPPERRRISC